MFCTYTVSYLLSYAKELQFLVTDVLPHNKDQHPAANPALFSNDSPCIAADVPQDQNTLRATADCSGLNRQGRLRLDEAAIAAVPGEHGR